MSVLYIPQSFKTEVLVSNVISGHSLAGWGSYPSTEVQSACSTTLADRTE